MTEAKGLGEMSWRALYREMLRKQFLTPMTFKCQFVNCKRIGAAITAKVIDHHFIVMTENHRNHMKRGEQEEKSFEEHFENRNFSDFTTLSHHINN